TVTSKTTAVNFSIPLYTINVLDEDGKDVVRDVYWNSSVSGDTVKTDLYATKANRNFYVKVAAYYNDTNMDNNVTVNFTASKDWENESNDTSSTARTLKDNKVTYGSITENDSADFFKIKVKKTCKVDITFGPKEITGNDTSWEVFIVNNDNESQSLFKGGTRQKKTVYLMKGTYYLCVKNPYHAENVSYMIKYKTSKLNLKKPVIKKFKVKKNSFWGSKNVDYISMSGNKDVSGYTVQVAKKANMSGKLTNSDVEIKDGVSSKKKISTMTDNLGNLSKYYVRVRGYVSDPFGKKVYGKWSKVKASK
ncbi:MAG: hypothetical protein K6F37_00695, partial [Lachnospiraceae bacterium]|nr:hypothetical protein [Lachnospiraceae bacterium]